MTLRWFDKRRDQLLEGSMARRRELAEIADFPPVKYWREAGKKIPAVIRLDSQWRSPTQRAYFGVNDYFPDCLPTICFHNQVASSPGRGSASGYKERA